MWVKYAQGEHFPGRATRRDTEASAPGSTAVLMSSAWDLFDVRHPLQRSADSLLKTLSLGVQRAVFEEGPLLAGVYRRRADLTRVLRDLECQACGIDALAAAVALLREAHEAGDRMRCLRIGISLHALLLMACASWPVIGFRSPLIAFFALFVFPLASDGALEVEVRTAEFRETADLLSIYMLILEDEGLLHYVCGKPTDQFRQMLCGRFGDDLLAAFLPRLRVVDGGNSSALRTVTSFNIMKEWGLSVVRRTGCEMSFPEKVFRAVQASAEDCV